MLSPHWVTGCECLWGEGDNLFYWCHFKGMVLNLKTKPPLQIKKEEGTTQLSPDPDLIPFVTCKTPRMPARKLRPRNPDNDQAMLFGYAGGLVAPQW